MYQDRAVIDIDIVVCFQLVLTLPSLCGILTLPLTENLGLNLPNLYPGKSPRITFLTLDQFNVSFFLL